MEDSEKRQIAEALRAYCGRYGTQNKAARSMRDVSAATVAQALNGKWELISDDMWRTIGAHVGCRAVGWAAVETGDYRLMTALLEDAREYGTVFAVTGDAGSGKSFAIRSYAAAHERVYVLQCNEYWNRKMFVSELLAAMGRDAGGYTVGEMMTEAVRTLKREDRPLVVLDEADKLTDHVLYFFITLYNQLEDCCGIVLCATDYLKKRVTRGLKLNTKGYKEIYSRIGRKFVELDGVKASDVAGICAANGITDRKAVREVMEDCEWDLRRVRRKIHAMRRAAAELADGPRVA